MDQQQLASLLVSFWTTGDHDSARVLADRLTEMPAEDVAAALVRFRVMVQVTPAMIDAGRAAFDGAPGAFAAIVKALRLPDEEISRLLLAVSARSEDANFPP